MVKKQVKLPNKSKSKKSRSMKKSQSGGTSNACTLPYSSQTPQYSGIGTSNIHNTNPQASLDLDNKFAGYGGPVPLGSSILGGGGSCSDEGVGTGSPKENTFKQYLTNMDANLSSITGGSSCSQNKPSPNSKPNSKQRGSGYSSDPSEFIGGQQVYKAYDDSSPPALINGQLIFGSPDQPVCGSGAISGGARRLRKKSKNGNNKSKKNKNGNNKSKKSKNRNNKSKKSKNRNKKRKTQKGGSDFNTLHSSKPAEYTTAFNGQPGVFKYPDDMTGRSFEGRQPNYGPDTI